MDVDVRDVHGCQTTLSLEHHTRAQAIALTSDAHMATTSRIFLSLSPTSSRMVARMSCSIWALGRLTDKSPGMRT